MVIKAITYLEVFGINVHSCNLNDPQEKVDLNFDNVFQLVDLWLANETTFEKTKGKKTKTKIFI